MDEQLAHTAEFNPPPHPQWRRQIRLCNGYTETGQRCGAREGELHRLGCMWEPRIDCGRQYIHCGRQFSFEGGQHIVWCTRSDPPETRQRVPFFRLTWLTCDRCGLPWPKFFRVDDNVWRFYILSLGQGEKLLCFDCFRLIAELCDGGDMLRRHGIQEIPRIDWQRIAGERTR